MRCFIAVELDTSLIEKIEPLQKELVNFDVKLVELNNLHFTLKFLGDIDQNTLNKIKEILNNLASNYTPFSVNIKNIGVFPNENFIRVVWMGVEELRPLQATVNESFSDIFKKEKPSPHLTIARVRSQIYRKEVIDFIDRHKNDKIGTMIVDTVKLKKSTVTSKGPIYEDLATFRLVGK